MIAKSAYPSTARVQLIAVAAAAVSAHAPLCEGEAPKRVRAPFFMSGMFQAGGGAEADTTETRRAPRMSYLACSNRHRMQYRR